MNNAEAIPAVTSQPQAKAARVSPAVLEIIRNASAPVATPKPVEPFSPFGTVSGDVGLTFEPLVT